MKSLEYFNENLQLFLQDLEDFVAIESPTGHLEQLECAADYLIARFDPLGEIERHTLADVGPLIHINRKGSQGRVLLLAHFDTVWPIGSWRELWNNAGDWVTGPGIYDMKGGLLFILWVLRYLESQNRPHPTLEILLTPDEEIGAPGSRPYIEEAARRADAVLVLEPSSPTGALKLARKGSGEYVITIHGKTSHQGVEPEKGVNAVVEAAHQVLRVLDLEDREAGTTVGPNVFDGGTASNMVPDRAEIRVDLRAWTAAETERLDQALRNLKPVNNDTQIHVFGGWNRLPMEPSAESLDLFQGVQSVGATLGLELEWVRWGGSSDANVAAAVGAPTIDGFGPIGKGAHQFEECIKIDEIPRRMALLAEVLGSLTLLPVD